MKWRARKKRKKNGERKWREQGEMRRFKKSHRNSVNKAIHTSFKMFNVDHGFVSFNIRTSAANQTTADSKKDLL